MLVFLKKWDINLILNMPERETPRNVLKTLSALVSRNGNGKDINMISAGMHLAAQHELKLEGREQREVMFPHKPLPFIQTLPLK